MNKILFLMIAIFSACHPLSSKKVEIPLSRSFELPQWPKDLQSTENLNEIYLAEMTSLPLQKIKSQYVPQVSSLPASSQIKIEQMVGGETWEIPLGDIDPPMRCILSDRFKADQFYGNYIQKLKKLGYKLFPSRHEDAFEGQGIKSTVKEFVLWKQNKDMMEIGVFKLKNYLTAGKKLEQVTCMHLGEGLHNTFDYISKKIAQALIQN